MDVTFFTPVPARDLDRFILLRESIERFGIQIPHIAIVDHESVHLFKSIPFQHDLTILSTRDVLPRGMDRRRQLWLTARRNPAVWFTPRRFPGWIAQQIIKLAAPKVVQTEGIICLDSDLFFIGNVTALDFVSPEGKLHFYESENGVDTELAEWYGRALRFLGHRCARIKPRRCMYNGVPFHRQVLLNLHQAIENQHGMDWMEAITQSRVAEYAKSHEPRPWFRSRRIEQSHWVTEYALYGAFCRHNGQLECLAPVEPSLCADCWYADEVDSMWRTIQASAKTGKKIGHLQSNLKIPVSSYRSRIEQIWRNIGDSNRDCHELNNCPGISRGGNE